MNIQIAAALGAVLLLTGTPSFSANSQQTKMSTCNADAKAKGLKGDERKAFMKGCLSAAGASATPAASGNSQQAKMKSCSADAKTKGLKGAERKSFMKSCLSGSGG